MFFVSVYKLAREKIVQGWVYRRFCERKLCFYLSCGKQLFRVIRENTIAVSVEDTLVPLFFFVSNCTLLIFDISDTLFKHPLPFLKNSHIQKDKNKGDEFFRNDGDERKEQDSFKKGD